MITFETQEEFEDAVMDVISQRLGILIESGGLPVNAIIQVTLLDKADDSEIDSCY